MEWDDGDNGDDGGSVECVPAKDARSTNWVSGCLADY
jgi:hypothetical protein